MKGFMESLKAKLVAWGPLGLFVIGVVDGAGLPNPSGPDVLLILFATAMPSQAMLGALCATLGSLVGTFIMYSVARKGGEVYLEKHTQSPRGRKLREWFQHYGLVTVFVPALVPIPMPLKLFVICSGAFAVNRVAFMATLAAARIPRYFALAWLGQQLGNNSLKWLGEHTLHLAGVTVALFALLFLLVRYVDYRKKRQTAAKNA